MPSEVPDQGSRDIIDNIHRIRGHLAGAANAAALDAKTRDAVERCLERISEAAKKLGSAVEVHHPQVPWRSIRGLGNVLRHMYDAVDDLTIDVIVGEHLEQVRQACVDELARRKGARGD